jgi:hypothetical protein
MPTKVTTENKKSSSAEKTKEKPADEAGGKPPESFKNIKAVAAYVIAQEYKIDQSSVYNHAKAGLLGKKKNGVYTLTQIQKYCRDYLVKKEAHQTVQQEGLARKKVETEISLQEVNYKLQEIKLAREEGRVIEKDIVYQQFAALTIGLENAVKGQATVEAEEAVQMIGDADNKPARFVEIFNDIMDRALNKMAKINNLEVIFGETE